MAQTASEEIVNREALRVDIVSAGDITKAVVERDGKSLDEIRESKARSMKTK